MRIALALCLVAALIAGAAAQNPSEAEKAEALLVARINQARAQYAPEAAALKSDPELVRIARQRANAMAHGAPFAHEDHEGRPVALEMVRARFGPYGAIGENIAMETNAGRAFDAPGFARRMTDKWLASPGHRENIVSPKYDSAGIGVAIIGDRAFAAQVFRGEAPKPRRTRPAPRMKGVGNWGPNGL